VRVRALAVIAPQLAPASRCAHHAARGIVNFSPYQSERRHLEDGIARRPLRPDPASAGHNRRRTLLSALGDGSSAAALADPDRARQIALAPVRAVEPRLVPRPPELPFRARAVPESAHAGLD